MVNMFFSYIPFLVYVLIDFFSYIKLEYDSAVKTFSNIVSQHQKIRFDGIVTSSYDWSLYLEC